MIRVIILLFISTSCYSQTWPSKGCPDVPYTKGNDGIIYHSCKCDTVRKFLCGPLYCPECNHITNEEHMTMLRANTDPDQWNADMERARSMGCPIIDHAIQFTIRQTGQLPISATYKP